MTKLISILFLVLCLSSVRQEEPMSRVATFNLPNNVEELSTTQGVTFIKQHYKYLAQLGDEKFFFKTGEIIIGFRDYVKHADFVDLQQKKESWLFLMKESKIENLIVRSDIITVKKTSFLILGNHYEDEYGYNITSEAKGKTGLSIRMRFKKADKAQAEKLLMDFLSGITFRPASIVNN